MAVDNLLAFRRQNILLEFAALKHLQLQGVYISLTPGDPATWNAVLFVRKGPYAPAVLRFRVRFPDAYPSKPPTLVFSTDVFHPLLSPLTTATFSSGANTPIGEEDGKLPPGGFNLRYAFPDWPFKKPKPTIDRSNQEGDSAAQTETETTPSEPVNAIDALLFVRSSFQVEDLIDAIPLDAAANPSAWYAWRSHRSRVKPELALPRPQPVEDAQKRESGSFTRPKGPSEWNWEGVWEERVKRAVQFTLTELSLYGTAGSAGREDEIQFVKVDPEQLEEMQNEVRRLALVDA